MGCLISPVLAAPAWTTCAWRRICREWVGIIGLMSGSSCGAILPLTQLAGRCLIMLSGQNWLMALIKPGVHHAAPTQEKEGVLNCVLWRLQADSLDSLSAGEGLKAEGGRMWGRHRKRQVVLAAPKHCLLSLPMLFYLLQLFREEALCRQSAWQIPEQGQALLCP